MSPSSPWTIFTLSWNTPQKEIFQRSLLPYSGCQVKENQIKTLLRTRTLGYLHTSGQCHEIFALDGNHTQRSQVRKHFYNWTRENQSGRFGNEQSYSRSHRASLSKSRNTNILCSLDNSTSTLFLPSWYLVLRMCFLLFDCSLTSLQRCNNLNSSIFCYLERSQAHKRELWRVFNKLHHFPSYKKSKNKTQYFRCEPHSKKQR